MTTQEAAEFLNVSPFTIFRLIRRESIKAKQFGKSWMIDAQSVRDYKERNEGKAKHDPRKK